MRERSYLAKGINVSSRILNGIAYIYLEDRLEFLTLNETGSYIWSQINGKRTLGEISECSRDAFDGSKEEVDTAVAEFLEMLVDQGMVVVSESAFEGVMADA